METAQAEGYLSMHLCISIYISLLHHKHKISIFTYMHWTKMNELSLQNILIKKTLLDII